MKQRLRWFPLMISLVLLAGCAGKGQGKQSGEDRALAIQCQFAHATACSGRFRLTADYGERTFECVLDATYDQVTGGTLTIAEPELVKGVTARFAEGEAALGYDGFSLELGPLTDEGISPMEALPTLWRQIAGGYMAAVEDDGETLTVTYRPDVASPGAGLEAAVVFDRESGDPTSGELFWDGARVAAVDVIEFQMISPETGEGADEHDGAESSQDLGGN